MENNNGSKKRGSNKTITPNKAFESIENPQEDLKCTILDVRTPWEHSKGYIKGAKNLDCTDPDFKEELLKLDKKQKYIVYCKTGIRGEKVTEIMKKNGFIDVSNLEGGIEAWKKKKLPLEE